MSLKGDGIEYSLHPQRDRQVNVWILKNEADVVKVSMIAPVREAADLDSPPVVYKSMNKGEKLHHVNRCKSS